MATLPVTETPNDLTKGLGNATPDEIVQLLRKCDEQMFSGYQDHPNMMDVISKLDQAAQHVADCLGNPGKSKIILTGSGTSGRMAFFIARQFNRVAKALDRPELAIFHYCCAGGDVALFASREAPEDDWRKGAESMQQLSKDAERVVLIGITCGLSAPYVGGQLQAAMDDADKYTPILLGFNTLAQARAKAIENCDWTFQDVVKRMQRQQHLIVNPQVGPEGVTGSTRMKGGSATKLLLECIMLNAFALQQQQSLDLATAISDYQRAMESAYSQPASLAAVIAQAHTALAKGGHIYYVGDGNYGIEALIDASECPPTYNARYGDVRAYLHQAYTTLANVEGDLAASGDPDLQLATDSLVSRGVNSADVVVFFGATMAELEHASAKQVLSACQAANTPVVRLLVGSKLSSDSTPDVDLVIDVPAGQSVPNSYLCELAMKLVFNAVTTGAYVRLGKVLTNRMIDLQVSNNKLFFRAIGIVETFAKSATATARQALLKAIHQSDQPETDLVISKHIAQSGLTSSQGVRVVPTAVLLASKPDLTFAHAQEILKQCSNVQEALTLIGQSN